MTDTAFYAKMKDLGERMLAKFGFTGTLTKEGVAGGVDDDGNYTAPGTPTSISGLITPKLDYKASEIDGSAIQTGDCYVFWQSDELATIDMKTELNGETWRVVAVGGITTVDGDVLFTRLQLRK